MLSATQFVHRELELIYLGLHSKIIPIAQAGRCQRLLDDVESATKPDDTDIPGNGYRQIGAIHSVDVNGVNRINYEWRNGQAADIDYV